MSKMCYKTNGKLTVPMVLRTQGGRGKSNGCTQSQSLESLFTHIPGLKVVMPSTPYDVKGILAYFGLALALFGSRKSEAA